MRGYAITLQDRYLKPQRSSFAGHPDPEWSDTVAGARIYLSEKELDRRLLEISQTCKDNGPWPEVVELEISVVRNIQHTPRFLKNRARTLKMREDEHARFLARRRLESEAEIRRLEESLEHARKRQHDAS
jgi:hypothetical protein